MFKAEGLDVDIKFLAARADNAASPAARCTSSTTRSPNRSWRAERRLDPHHRAQRGGGVAVVALKKLGVKDDEDLSSTRARSQDRRHPAPHARLTFYRAARMSAHYDASTPPMVFFTDTVDGRGVRAGRDDIACHVEPSPPRGATSRAAWCSPPTSTCGRRARLVIKTPAPTSSQIPESLKRSERLHESRQGHQGRSRPGGRGAGAGNIIESTADLLRASLPRQMPQVD